MLEGTPEMLAASHYILLGLVELGNRNYKKAEAQFNQAIQEFPESHAAILGRALASMMQLHEIPLDESASKLKLIIPDLERLLENSKKMLENITVITEQK